MSDRWAGTDWHKADRPPFRVERRPYEACPNCREFAFRPVYDGRRGESVARCSNCRYEEETDAVPENVAVDESDGSLLALAFFIVIVLSFLGLAWVALADWGVVG